MEYVAPPSVHRVLCADCGMYTAGTANINTDAMCSVDITEGIPKQATVNYCRNCERFLSPPNTWTIAQPESRELLAICLKKLKGLNKVRLIDAGFIWTEPHSKRVKVKLTIQKEVRVFTSTILQQIFEVEYIVVYGQCPDCTRLAAKNTWKAMVQVRQKVNHKRTFLYLEQLILKHSAQKDTINVKEAKDGLDFFYTQRSHAIKMVEFLNAVVPIRSVLFAASKSRETNGYIPLTVCTRVGNSIHLIDPATLRSTDLSSPIYWRTPFESLATVSDLVEFTILDIDPSGKTNGRWVLADAQVAPNNAFQSHSTGMDVDEQEGSTSTIYHTRTHLGGILQPGDTALGYFLSRANFNSDEFDALDSSRVPDVVLVKKTYPNRRKKSRARNWRLRSIAKEANEDESGEGRGALGRRGGLDQARVEADYEAFLQDLEEDPELRATVNLYKSEPKERPDEKKVGGGKKGGQYAMEGVEATEEEEEDEGDFPEVKIDELLDHFEEMGLEDEQNEAVNACSVVRIWKCQLNLPPEEGRSEGGVQRR
ncbi:RNA binding protein [Rhizoctonia solani AG-1 IA]|uniref:60S ribosomal export protein NMD3 n=1 Tax=Thanatephorus cucumeris (strain AG1-IA) TaxID=983506 RepID=L8WT94_THACA|nr:RNA binding protein [Rhizoctonia solani AG-1 IA]